MKKNATRRLRLDAPGVIRNLLLCGAAGPYSFGATVHQHLWSGDITLNVAGTGPRQQHLSRDVLVDDLGQQDLARRAGRERLLDRISWTGGEQVVLDVGCGRGLMLVAAALRLQQRHRHGHRCLAKARIWSGIRTEVLLKTPRTQAPPSMSGWKRPKTCVECPFAPESFDVIVSRAAIHNLYQQAERAAVQAISEIVRVLKPGGHALIDDIRHIGEYANAFARGGCPEVRRYGSRISATLLALLTFGSLRPGSLVVRKGP